MLKYRKHHALVEGLTALTILLALVFVSSTAATAATKTSAKKPEQRIIEFPNDVSLGRLELHLINNSITLRDLGEAKGTVKVVIPAGHQLLFNPGKAVGKDPLLLRRAPTKGIDAIKLKFLSMEENNESVTDKILKELTRFKDLQRLDLGQSDVTDEGLEPIASLSKLKSINLFSTEIHGTCLKTLKNLPMLEDLDISNDSIETTHVHYLQEMESLHILNVRKTGANREATRQLGKCKTLVALYLGVNRRVDDDCMNSLLPLRNLTVLSLDATLVTKAGVLKLTSLPLVRMELPPSIKTAQDVAELQKAFPKCLLLRTDSARPVSKLEQRVFAPLK